MIIFFLKTLRTPGRSKDCDFFLPQVMILIAHTHIQGMYKHVHYVYNICVHILCRLTSRDISPSQSYWPTAKGPCLYALCTYVRVERTVSNYKTRMISSHFCIKESDFLNIILEQTCSNIKGTVAPVWVWLKVVWLERAKIGKEPLSILKIFHSYFNC